MADTGVEHELLADQARHYHHKKGKTKSAKYVDLSNRVPGGGFYTTVEDLLKFGQAILDHSLISEASLAEMTTDYGFKKEGNGYGLGWYLYGTNPTHGDVFGHNGGQAGCSSFLMLLPKTRTVIAVLSNTSGDRPMQTVGNITTGLFSVAEDANRP